jgi:hypothetical protein
MWSILFSLIMLLPSFAFAQNKVGNGGNVIRCQIENKPTVALLDFYEGDIHPQFQATDPQEIAKQVLSKIKTVAPKIADQYLKRLSQINAEIEYKEEIELVEVPDSKHLFKPLSKNCEVLQIAVRNNVALSSEKRFLIRKDLWQQMDPVQQAGLLTHEIIHEHLTKLGEKDSIKARKINVFLYSDKTKPSEFWDLIKELEVSIYP